MKFLLFIYLLFNINAVLAQTNSEKAALENISKARKNKIELEKAFRYYNKTKDSLKYKAMLFLLSNMDVHYSTAYYWADSNGNKIPFSEYSFDNYLQYESALDSIKRNCKKIHPKAFQYNDIDSVKCDMLVENIEYAFKVKERYNLDNDKFFEYILPYKCSIEHISIWRRIYNQKFKNQFPSKGYLEIEDAKRLSDDIKKWFTNTYKIQSKDIPVPRLSALQLLNRHKGPCEDIADLVTLIARSQGIPAAIDFIPAWATASGTHFLNYLPINPSLKTHYDAADGFILDTLSREPAKVLRTTYSKQKETIAYKLQNDTSLIPPNFLRSSNYIDVTPEYWKTSNVIVKSLFKLKNIKPKAVFASVWNFGRWQPIWYDMISENKTVSFSNLAKGAVYLPVYYLNHELVPASWPIINAYDNVQTILKPDTTFKRKIIIENQPGYLIFRKDKKYNLFFWNYGWVHGGTKVAESAFAKLEFDNIPDNALLLLIPEYSEGKERPFIIDKSGKRLWF